MRWMPYVPVAERRARAAREVARRTAASGRVPSPIAVEGRRRQIATSYWGQAWCANLERYSDFENRLPRGRRYLKNGSVVDLSIEPGTVRALVAGSELYEIAIRITKLAAPRWRAVQEQCRGKVGSLVSLLRGQLSDEVMEVLTRPKTGLFPEPREIDMDCSCPDSAALCKHLAATLYGVGVRLDREPELFFVLRQVDQAELVSAAVEVTVARPAAGGKKKISADRLGALFGIDVEVATPQAKRAGSKRGSGGTPRR